MSVLKNVIRRGMDTIFPPRCTGCNTWSEDLFCSNCRAQLYGFTAPLCEVCGGPVNPAAEEKRLCYSCRANRKNIPTNPVIIRSCYVFDGPVREAIHHLKYENRTSSAALLGKEMADFWRTNCRDTLHISKCDIITPVPLHWWRRYRRGYNQSELLAHGMAAQLNIPAKVLLQRFKPTHSQVHLSKKRRAENVAGAFSVKESENMNVRGAIILLIDDVCTTGATIRECASALRRGGARAIYAITLSRQITDTDKEYTISLAS